MIRRHTSFIKKLSKKRKFHKSNYLSDRCILNIYESLIMYRPKYTINKERAMALLYKNISSPLWSYNIAIKNVPENLKFYVLCPKKDRIFR